MSKRIDTLRCEGCGRVVLPPGPPTDRNNLICIECGAPVRAVAGIGPLIQLIWLATLAVSAIYVYTNVAWDSLLKF